MALVQLITELQQSLGILSKQDIQVAARSVGQSVSSVLLNQYGGNGLATDAAQTMIRLGDDCAAIPDGDEFLLLAAEGMWPLLVETEPWFAGWCAVLVNVSDIYAMGGRPIAVVDAIWSQSALQSQPIWQGMVAASKAFNVPIVGGHTNSHSPYSALSVAILGKAKRLLTSFEAQPGQTVLLVADFRGKAHPKYPFWDAATLASPGRLQADLALLPHLAESGLCRAGKDISMGGLIGTCLMLLEASGCGAVVHIDQIPKPVDVPLSQWLVSFPSYGFLLSVEPAQVATVQHLFEQRQLVCAPIGQITAGSCLQLTWQDETQVFWDLQQQPLTGFSHF